jgi:polyisoprenoid-binding protein YceI
MAEGVAVRTVENITVPEPGTYVIDPIHSVVEFVVRHLGLAKVRGRFNQFEGTINIAEEPLQSSARVTIQAASIDTRDPDRDAHLRSPDFLDVERYPTLDWVSTRVRRDGDRWLVDGDLTIRDVTRNVTLDVEFEGGAKDPWGNPASAFRPPPRSTERTSG